MDRYNADWIDQILNKTIAMIYASPAHRDYIERRRRMEIRPRYSYKPVDPNKDGRFCSKYGLKIRELGMKKLRQLVRAA